MDTNEDLDSYKGAYSTGFKFFEENQWYLAHYAKRIGDVLKENSVQTFLSLGIGHRMVCSCIMEHISSKLKKYTILEGSEEIIRNFKAQSELPSGVEAIHTYFEEFESAEQFDAIEMGFILEHVDDPGYILRKYREFLKPGGVLFVAVPNARSLHRMIGHEAGLLDDIYKLSPQDYELGHKRYFDLTSISSLVVSSGLTISRCQGLMLKPVTGEQIQQLGWGHDIIRALMRIGDDYPEIANCILLEATR